MPKLTFCRARLSLVFVRIFSILLLSVGVIGGVGCFTVMLVAADFNGPTTQKMHSDTIFAVAVFDEGLARRLNTKDGIAFLGERNTYLMVQGGAQLLRIAKEVDGNKLKLDPNQGHLYLDDKVAWGKLS